MSLIKFNTIVASPPGIRSDDISSTAQFIDANTYNYILESYSSWKIPVKVATTEQITLKGSQTIDGVLVTTGDRVLVKNQIGGSDSLDGFLDNGIYVVNQTWTRADDFQYLSDPVGATIYVEQGDINGGMFFYCTNVVPDKVGTSILSFTQLKGISSGVLNSIQYNYPVGHFKGSSSFTYDHTNRELLLGSEGKTSVIESNFTSMSIISNNNANTYAKSGDLYLRSGTRGDSTGSTLNIVDGDIDIKLGTISGVGTTSTLNVSINTSDSVNGQSGIIDIATGINGGSVYITSGKPNVDVISSAKANYIQLQSESIINLVTSGITTIVENGGLTLFKDIITVSTFSTLTINAKQGIITITNPSSLAANTSVNVVINNTYALSTSLIFAGINTYTGTGTPIIEVVSRSNGQFTFQITNINTVSSLSNTNLLINFLIF